MAEEIDKIRKARLEELKHRQHVIREWTWTACIFVFVLIVVFSTLYTIPAGNRGVLLTFGKPTMEAQGEGLHIKIPFVQTVVRMDVRTQKYQANLTAASKDLQDVATVIAINYKLNPDKVPLVFQTIGTDYSDVVIYPIEQEINKAVTSTYTAEELITRRDEVRAAMQEQLTNELARYNIIVQQVSIVNFQFSESFSTAIEQKVTAEQNALKEQNNLRVIQFQAQQQVAAAQGTAQSIEIINKQLTKSPEYLQWQAIQKWNGALPNVIGGANPFFDIKSYLLNNDTQ